MKPVFVYSMGKVGSTSMGRIMDAAKIPHIHAHSYLYDYFDIPMPQRNSIDLSNKFIAEVKREGKKKVVTLVRDPIARSVSAFFHRLADHIPQAYRKLKEGSLTNQDLLDYFVKEFPHHWSLFWFDNQIKYIFNLDVYEKPFNVEAGASLINTSDVDLLILRLEDFDRSCEDSLVALLGRDGLKPLHIPPGTTTEEQMVYKKFIKEVKMPREFLDIIYNTKHAKHFYTEKEIEGFKEFWS